MKKRQLEIVADPLAKPNYSFYADIYTFKDEHEATQGYQHYHDHYEIVYVSENNLILSINNDDYVLDNSCVALIPPFIFHGSISGDSPKQTRYKVSFKEDFINHNIKLFDINLLSCFNLKCPVVKLTEGQKEKIHNLLREISTLYDEYREKGDIYIKIKFLLHLCNLLASCTQIQSDSQSLPHHHLDITGILKYIEKNYFEDITLDMLSVRFHINRYKLSRHFKMYTGTNMLNYVNKIRIMNAKEILSKSDLKITDIAGKTGFNNLTHFNRVFKRETGCSPSQYRTEYHYTRMR